MTLAKQISYTLFVIAIALFLFLNTAFADHEAMVAGQVVPLADTSLSHGENCDDVHYHGELNGVPDPAPDGCGHGIVTILPHDEDGESIVPKEESEEEEDDSPSAWGRFTDWLDAVFQGLTGGFSPKTVSDSVDIVEDATPSLRETADNAEEYFDTYEDAPSRERYTLEDENPEENAPAPSLYRRFWSLFE
ncbi:hypothetical protein CL654_01395 [bacterium]|nr:hypothetical protein [bacterium]|tara:strand:+ start:17211 stop:17783 length:573 start_codon:yes stop_codon:yes gene_type:complete